jgi:hypothetical protein
MTGDDKNRIGKVQSQGPVETCVGIAEIPHGDQARLSDDQPAGTLQAGQSAKGDEKITSTNPNIVVAEQWLCLLLGLVCMVCGILGMGVKYSQVSSSAHIRWLGSALGPILRLTAISCFAFGVVLVRLGWARPNRSSISVRQPISRSNRGNHVRGSSVFPLNGGFYALGGNGKESINMKDDIDDIPMVYLLYVVLAIVALAAGVAIVVAKIL